MTDDSDKFPLIAPITQTYCLERDTYWTRAARTLASARAMFGNRLLENAAGSGVTHLP